MKCAHPNCNCLERTVQENGRRYCCEHCAEKDRQKQPLGRCGCGHAGCD